MVKNYDKNGREIKDLSKITLPVKGFEATYRLLQEIAEKQASKREVIK